ncbi:MAG: phenylalanine--tRNA ligase subunit beta [Bacteroidetes bacterium]|nr:phenylalanine--tRNA ligase subunit beta [Bacteroidota bacterium]
MKLSLNWLKSHVDVTLSDNELAELLTNTGLEVEEVESFSTLKSDLSGVVVGKVLHVEQHPNADKLKLTKVDIGADELLHIVCGAPNVAQNQLVPVATIGTTLVFPNGDEVKIKKGKIRGEVSEGMLCAEDELGIGESHDGIMVLDSSLPIGTPLVNHIELYNDTVFEIGLTPNRVDAANHRGAARDVAAVLNKPIIEQEKLSISVSNSNNDYKISIQNPDACPRYSALLVRNVKANPSPQWLQNRLKAIGIQPNNILVDATNYVMQNIGHPLHAFDYKQVAGKEIVVRTAKKGEKLITLDNIERELLGNELLICNVKEPMALAGVLGGKHSGISDNTTDVLLECAYFNPGIIRKGAKQHQIHTDASFRFERGVDPNMTIEALEMTAYLLKEYAGGQIDNAIIDAYPKEMKPVEITLAWQYLTRLSGISYSPKRVKEILQNLGIIILNESSESLVLQIPTNKPDVSRPCDVVEEIMRIDGFNNVPLNNYQTTSLPTNHFKKKESIKSRLVQSLNGQGFHQIKTNPLIATQSEKHVLIANPLSNDLSGLRSSVLESGLDVLAYNLNRQQEHLKFFEIANEFERKGTETQISQKLVLWVTGLQYASENWLVGKSKLNVYYLKGVVETILQAAGINDFNTIPFINKGNFEYGLDLMVNEELLGTIGKLSVNVAKAKGIGAEVFVAELHMPKLQSSTNFGRVKFRGLNKFPTVTRDISFLVNSNITYSTFEKAISSLNIKFLKSFTCFDVYKAQKNAEKVSYAMRFVFENEEKTLKDKQVEHFMSEIMSALERAGCEIRK